MRRDDIKTLKMLTLAGSVKFPGLPLSAQSLADWKVNILPFLFLQKVLATGSLHLIKPSVPKQLQLSFS